MDLKNGKPDKFEAIKPSRKINKKKVIQVIIMTIIFSIFITIITLYSENEKVRNFFDIYVFNKEIYEGKNNTINFDTSNIDVSSIYSYNDKIVILDQNQLKIYNKYGNEEYSIEVEVKTPVFESNNEYLCIWGKDDQKVFLISERQIIWEKEVEDKIYDISVNKNGYVAIAFAGTSHKTVVELLDKDGNEILKNYLSTENVIATSTSEDNKYLAIAEVDFSGIVIQSTIQIISIEDAIKNNSKAIEYTYKAKQDNLITNIKYQNNILVCMYDDHIDAVKNNKRYNITNLNEENTLFADINLSKNIAKVIKNSDNNTSAKSQIQIINPENKDQNIYSLESIPKKLNIYDQIMAVNLGTQVLFIKNNGWLVKKYKSSQEIQNIVLCNGIAGIIYKDKIEIIDL